MKTTFTIPFEKLRVAAMFASDDEMRVCLNGVHVEQPSPGKIILVATDGRRMVAIRHEPDSPVEAFADFTIPVGLIVQADPSIKARAYNALAYDIGIDESENYPGELSERADVLVTCEDGRVSIVSKHGSGITFTGDDLATKESRPFPKWRECFVPIRGDANPRSAIILNGWLIADFGKAARMLNPHSSGVLITGYGQDKEHANNPHVVAVRFDSYPDFVGVIMPMKLEQPAVATVPDWLS